MSGLGLRRRTPSAIRLLVTVLFGWFARFPGADRLESRPPRRSRPGAPTRWQRADAGKQPVQERAVSTAGALQPGGQAPGDLHGKPAGAVGPGGVRPRHARPPAWPARAAAVCAAASLDGRIQQCLAAPSPPPTWAAVRISSCSLAKPARVAATVGQGGSRLVLQSPLHLPGPSRSWLRRCSMMAATGRQKKRCSSHTRTTDVDELESRSVHRVDRHRRHFSNGLANNSNSAMTRQ